MSSYYGRIDDRPDDALRFFPPRGKAGGEAGAGPGNAAAAGLGNETLAAVVARLKAEIEEGDEAEGEHGEGDDGDGGDGVDHGNHNQNWEDGHSSWDEFGHDNDPSVCRMRTMTVDEWEAGRHWRGNVPVMVTNVTDGWVANVNWRLDEMLRRYPDAEATMGDGRRVGEIGPDAAGRLLSPTTVKVRLFPSAARAAILDCIHPVIDFLAVALVRSLGSHPHRSSRDTSRGTKYIRRSS